MRSLLFNLKTINMEQWKIDVIEVYNETSFKECVMYCTEQNIISSEYETKILSRYDYNEDAESEVICDFFDDIEINEDEFLEIQELLS